MQLNSSVRPLGAPETLPLAGNWLAPDTPMA